MFMAGKSAVITGAGSGVGRAAAQIFAAQGAKVVCADINPAWVEETVSIVTGQGGVAVAQSCDVREKGDIEAMLDRAVAEFGRLDILYNNVGIATASDGKKYRLIDQDDTDFERLVSINYRGVLLGCQGAVRRFLAQGGGGAIVNTASVAGMVGWGGVMYGSTKGAVIQLTRGLAVEVAREGIRVNAVAPAGMMTSFGHAAGRTAPPTAEQIEAYGRMHPMGQPIEPENCANAAMFLASDLARNITGVILPVDGGFTAA